LLNDTQAAWVTVGQEDLQCAWATHVGT
jgi:hypothetical protein